MLVAVHVGLCACIGEREREIFVAKGSGVKSRKLTWLPIGEGKSGF